MKFSLKSLMLLTAVVALVCAVAIFSYRRGRQDEREANPIWNVVEVDQNYPFPTPSFHSYTKEDWNLETIDTLPPDLDIRNWVIKDQE